MDPLLGVSSVIAGASKSHTLVNIDHPIERMPAVLDASFWINAFRMGIVHHLTDYFFLHVPPKVVTELLTLLRQQEPPPTSVAFAEWLHDGLVYQITPNSEFGRFHAGENEAIAVAQERGWVLLIDNSGPRDWSRGVLNLRVSDSAAFAVFLYEQGHLHLMETTAALTESRASRRVVRESVVELARLSRQRTSESK